MRRRQRIASLTWILSWACAASLLASEPVHRLPPLETPADVRSVQWVEPEPLLAIAPPPPAPPAPSISPAPLPSGAATAPLPPAPSAAPAPIVGLTTPEAAIQETREYTLEELRAEMKKLAWTKGDFKIVPYGILWANTSYETSRTYVGDYTFYVLSDDDQGEDSYHVDGRSTRLGLDVIGPRLWQFGCAETGGRVEFDFQGSLFPENKGTVLLRHAYVEAKDETFRLLAGQTWDVISPLYPGLIMYSVGWGGGNIGYRRAQFRAERYYAYSDNLLLTLQGSINHDLINNADCPTGVVEGDHAGWPVLQGRVATTLGPRGKGCLPWTVGVSGHIGEQIYDFLTAPVADDVARKTWSFNVDVHMPLTERLGFQGEFFTGENLGSYLGGILQGIDRYNRDGIRSTGGWFEVWYNWTPALHSHVGYSLDDPRDEDISPLNANGRIYNDFIFANLLWNVTPKLLMGVEFTYWETLYKTKSPGESARVEFAVKYGF